MEALDFILVDQLHCLFLFCGKHTFMPQSTNA